MYFAKPRKVRGSAQTVKPKWALPTHAIPKAPPLGKGIFFFRAQIDSYISAKFPISVPISTYFPLLTPQPLTTPPDLTNPTPPTTPESSLADTFSRRARTTMLQTRTI
jgi:hypothetical protein